MAPFSSLELRCLLEVCNRLFPDDVKRLKSAVQEWIKTADDDKKAELQGHLRAAQLDQRYHTQNGNEHISALLDELNELLQPDSAVVKHRWLFERSHITCKALEDEDDQGRLTYQQRDARIKDRRKQAIFEITEELGESAVFPFAMSVKEPDLVAEILYTNNDAVEIGAKWVDDALHATPDEASNKFLYRILWAAGSNEQLPQLAETLKSNGMLVDAAERIRFAKALPGNSEGWKLAEALGEDTASAYWNSIYVRIFNDTPEEEIEYAVKRLLEFNRPRSAFNAVEYLTESLKPEQWVDILNSVARIEEAGVAPPTAYSLNQVFEILDNTSEITDQEIANLELPFISLLRNHGYSTSTRKLAIHREVARDPNLFLEMLTWMYRRDDGTVEPENDDMSDSHKKNLWRIAFNTLEEWDVVPGQQEDGQVNGDEFAQWTGQLLTLSAEKGRRGIAEVKLASFLARIARRNSWEDWLPEYMLDLLDAPENKVMRESFHTGIINARGVTVRGSYDGGEQERRLANRYRDLASRYSNSYPRVSALLNKIADGYESEAQDMDNRAEVGERWRH